MAEERVLEMTVIGASNLKDVNILSKMETFAVVRLAPYVEYMTDVDSKHGVNPVWNEKFGFLVPEQLLQRGDAKIKVEIYTLSTLGQKFVSEASIPLSDISTSSRKNQPHRRYPLKTGSGDFQGELSVAFTLQDKVVLSKSDDYPIMRPPITKPTQPSMDFDDDYPTKPSKTQPYNDAYRGTSTYDSESDYEHLKPIKTQPSQDFRTPRTQNMYDVDPYATKPSKGQSIGGEYVDQGAPYKNPQVPLTTSQVTPLTYPSSQTPYSSSQTPYPTPPAPFQSSQTPYLTPQAPYPSSQASYPTSQTPHLSSQTPYPSSQTPYPTSQKPYPGSQAPYPTTQTPHMSLQTPYPSSQTPYPTSQTHHPSSQTPYPSSQTPYPTSQAPPPSLQTPYPSSQTPYPSSQTPYPGSQTPFPSSQPPYPSTQPSLNSPLGNIFSTPLGKVLLSDLSKSTIPHEPTYY